MKEWAPTNALILGALGAVVLAGCASKGSERPPERRGAEAGSQQRYDGLVAKPISLLFATMDEDGDYAVTTEELASGLASDWAKLAADGAPRQISYAKWSKAALGARYALPGFLTLDRNGDGRLSEIEFTQYFQRQFTTLDRNNDARLDREELLFMMQSQPRREGSGSQERSRDSGRRRPQRQ